MIQATLATARLTLAPATHEALDAIWAIWRVEEIFHDVVLPSHARRLGVWLARRRERDEVIGTVGLLPVTRSALYAPRLAGEIEVLAAFDPAAWGCGYATETLEALVDYAFRVVGLSRVAAAVDVPNDASHRLVGRLGFAVSGEFLGPRYPFRTYVLTAASFARRARVPAPIRYR